MRFLPSDSQKHLPKLSQNRPSFGGSSLDVLGLLNQVALGFFFLTLCLLVDRSVYATDASSDIAELKERQKQVQRVVKVGMSATVSIRDGAGEGSGVIIDEDGLILTAAHVMSGRGSNMAVVLSDGTPVRAKKLGKNLDVDLGLAQIIDEGPFPAVEVASEGKLELGDWVVSLGHPGGYELGRSPPVRLGRLLSHGSTTLVSDCIIIGGDSGGPMFNMEGQLIAIHSSIGPTVTSNRHSNLAAVVGKKDWQRMLDGETWGNLGGGLALGGSKKNGGSLGIRIDQFSSQALVIGVSDGGAASEAGMEVDDVIFEFAGARVADSLDLLRKLQNQEAGDEVEIKVYRDSEQVSLGVVLGKKQTR